MHKHHSSTWRRSGVFAALVSLLPSATGWWYYMPQAAAQSAPAQASDALRLPAPLDVAPITSTHSAEIAKSLFDASTIPVAAQTASPDQLHCGPCALYNLLKSRGVSTSIPELTMLSHTDQHGTTMLGLKEAAAAKGIRLEGTVLRSVDEIRAPFIAFVGNDHFLQVESVDQRTVRVVEQSGKFRDITREAFESNWLGEALAIVDPDQNLEPLPDFYLSKLIGRAWGGTPSECGFPRDSGLPYYYWIPDGGILPIYVEPGPRGGTGAPLLDWGACDCMSGKAMAWYDSPGHVSLFKCVSDFAGYPDPDRDGSPDGTGRPSEWKCSFGCDDSDVPAADTSPATVSAPAGAGMPLSPLQEAAEQIQSGIAIPGTFAAVDMVLGGLNLVETDIEATTVEGLTLHFTREYYNKNGLHWDPRGGLGYTWTHSYNIRLSVGAQDDLTLENTSGIPVTFIRDTGSGIYYSVNPVAGTADTSYITRSGDSYTLKKRNGVEYRFGTIYPGNSGKIQSMAARGGSQLTMTYDGSSRLTKVSTPAADGRYLALQYDANSLITNVSLKNSSNSVISQVDYGYTTIADNVPDREDPADPNHIIYTSSLMEYSNDKSTVFNVNNSGLTYHLAWVQKDGLQIGGTPVKRQYQYARHTILWGAAATTDTWYHSFRTGLGYGTAWAKTVLFKFVDLSVTPRVNLAQERRAMYNTYYLAGITDENGNQTTINVDYPNKWDNANSTRGVWVGSLGMKISRPDGVDTTVSYNGGSKDSVVENIQRSNGALLNHLEYDAQTTSAPNFPYIIKFFPLGASSGSTASWNYLKDGFDRITSVLAPGTDTSNPYLALSYNDGRIATFTLASGLDTVEPTWTYEYSTSLATRAPTKITDPTNVSSTFTIGTNERLDGYKPAAANQTAGFVYTYNAAGQLTKTTDPNGVDWNYTRDARGNITQLQYLENGTSRSQSYTYNDLNQILTKTDEAGSVTTYDYATAANAVANAVPVGTLLKVTNAGGIPTKFEYNKNGLVTKVTPYLDSSATSPGPITAYTYDNMNRVSTVTVGSAPARTTAYQYNLLGKMTKVVDPKGNATVYTYDEMGRVTKVDDAITNNEVTYGYTPIGALTKVTVNKSGVNQVWTYAYDAYNRLTTTTDPASHTLTYNYDPAGRVTKVKAGAGGVGNEFVYAYETSGYAGSPNYLRGIPREYTYPTDFGGTFVQKYDYDAQGRVIEIHDPTEAGLEAYYPTIHGVQYAYDALNRPTSISKYDATEASFTYNIPGRAQTVTDAYGRAQTYTYDSRYRLSSIAAPGSKTWSFEYTGLNQLTKYTHPNGMKTKYLFDADNLLLDQMTHENSAGTVLQKFNYLYDNNRNISKIIENSQPYWTYANDARNRLTSAVWNNTAGTIKATYGYTFDAADNIATKVGPWADDFGDANATDDWTSSIGTWSVVSGRAQNNVDAVNNVQLSVSATTPADASVEMSFAYTLVSAPTNNQGIVVHPRYVSSTNRVKVNFMPNQVQILQLSGSTWTTLATNTTATSTVGSTYQARIEAEGNQIRVYRQPAGGGLESLVLTATTTITAAGSMNFIGLSGGQYQLDDIRLLSDDLSRTTTMTYNIDNSIASSTDYNGAVNYTYDAWGRPIWLQRTINGVAQYLYFIYGMDGKLIRTDGRGWTDFGKQITDTYAGDGTRRSRFVWDSNIFVGDTTGYYYAGRFKPINEVHGTDVKTYVGGLAEAKGTSGAVGTYSYYANDHLGSTRGAYNDAQTAVAKLEYEPFGGAFMTQGGSEITRRFTGHTLDPLSGLYVTPYRAYNSGTGRWLQPDPLGMVNGPNMYSYVGGNPLNATDPLGLEVLISIWMPDAEHWGHASITFLSDRLYASYGPSHRVPGGGIWSSLRDLLPFGAANYDPNHDGTPDYTFRLKGLDEAAMRGTWDRTRGWLYHGLFNNCTTATARMLEAGGLQFPVIDGGPAGGDGIAVPSLYSMRPFTPGGLYDFFRGIESVVWLSQHLPL